MHIAAEATYYDERISHLYIELRNCDVHRPPGPPPHTPMLVRYPPGAAVFFTTIGNLEQKVHEYFLGDGIL